MFRIKFLSLISCLLTTVSPLTAQKIVWDRTNVDAWKGERIGLKAEVTNVTDGEELTLSVSCDILGVSATWLGYVITDDFKTCGKHPDNIPPYLVADRITKDKTAIVGKEASRSTVNSQQSTEVSSVSNVSSTQNIDMTLLKKSSSFWVTVEVPRNIAVGKHDINIALKNKNGNIVATSNTYINVQDSLLPEPKDYKFHLDLWQQPYAVSRYYKVKPWSKAHIDLLRPYAKMLARAGQKVVSTILFYEPWGEQSNDKFEPMVTTTKTKDGKWKYDYAIFDKWVSLMGEYGIDQQIDCYSMIPWDMSFRYWDEKTKKYAYIKTTVSSEEYKELWTDFLIHFADHLKKKGWFEKTCIAMDERGLKDMLTAYDIAQKAVPGLKMALAGNYHKELVDLLQDYSLFYGQKISNEELRQRREQGKTTTFYTCCSNETPNLFSNSAPEEAASIPIYCYENGFDGYLHWSWMNWTDNPETDTRFKLFPPGDTYFIYPEGCSSVRFEKLIEGIQQYEKILIRNNK